MVKFVTTLGNGDFNNLGTQLFDSWVKFAGKNELLVFLDNLDILEGKTWKNVSFYTIDNPEYKPFLEFCSTDSIYEGRVDTSYEYRFDVKKFSHKVFAMVEGLKYLTPKDDLYVWWDADAFLTAPVTEQMLKTKLGPLDWIAAYLGRKDWDHTETGFIAYNLKNKDTVPFIEDFLKIYTSHQIFRLGGGRTDSHVFDLVRESYTKYRNGKFKNISVDVAGQVIWEKTLLNEFSAHMKGMAAKIKSGMISQEDLEKAKIPREKLTKRYEQLWKIIPHFKVSTITDIGLTDYEFLEEMLSKVDFSDDKSVVYFGFSHFDDADMKIYEDIHSKLKKFQETHPKFFFTIFNGDVSETLPKFLNEPIEIANDTGALFTGYSKNSDLVIVRNIAAKDTILRVWSFVKHNNLVVLDGHFDADEFNRCPNTNVYGSNFLLKTEPDLKLMPHFDRLPGGGVVRLILGGTKAGKIKVKEPELRTANPPQSAGQNNKGLKIETRNAIPNEELQASVAYTCEKMLELRIPEIPALELHDKVAYMVGGSPSFKKEQYLNQIKEAAADGKDKILFTSKTAHDYLISQGIIPYGCILLDPRPHVSEYFTVHPDVTYFVASQCHRSVLDKLIENKCKIFVYHAEVAAGERDVVKKYFPNGKMIPGGTTSQTRGLTVLAAMGFYKFKLFGVDSSYESRPDKVHGINQEKQAMEIAVNFPGKPESEAKKFWTDPELLAQINDLEHLTKVFAYFDIDCQSEGLMALMLSMWLPPKGKIEELFAYKGPFA